MVLTFGGALTAGAQGMENRVYDLSIGVERHYSTCDAYGISCIEPDLGGIEKVLDHVQFGDHLYARVEFTAYEWDHNLNGQGGYVSTPDTIYYRVEERRLYQRSENGDSLVFDFSFEDGDDFQSFFNDWLPVPLEEYLWENSTIPNSFDYDTTVTFPNGNDFRVVYAHGYYQDEQLPSQRYFVEQILTENRMGFLTPSNHDSLPLIRPVYYIEQVGIVFHELSQHRLALVGYIDSDGTEYGGIYEPTSAQVEDVPIDFALRQNYPNPFNPGTSIRYQLPYETHVRLEVYDMLGRRVAVLQDSRLPAGEHQITFNASGLPSGMYVYRIQIPGYSINRQMTLIK